MSVTVRTVPQYFRMNGEGNVRDSPDCHRKPDGLATESRMGWPNPRQDCLR